MKLLRLLQSVILHLASFILFEAHRGIFTIMQSLLIFTWIVSLRDYSIARAAVHPNLHQLQTYCYVRASPDLSEVFISNQSWTVCYFTGKFYPKRKCNRETASERQSWRRTHRHWLWWLELILTGNYQNSIFDLKLISSLLIFTGLSFSWSFIGTSTSFPWHVSTIST